MFEEEDLALFNEFKTYPSRIAKNKWEDIPKLENPDDFSSYFIKKKKGIIRGLKWPGYFYSFIGFLASQKKLPIKKSQIATYDKVIRYIFAIKNTIETENVKIDDDYENTLKSNLNKKYNPNLILFNVYRLLDDDEAMKRIFEKNSNALFKRNDYINNILLDFYKKNGGAVDQSLPRGRGDPEGPFKKSMKDLDYTIKFGKLERKIVRKRKGKSNTKKSKIKGGEGGGIGGEGEFEVDIPSLSQINIGFNKKVLGGEEEYNQLHIKYPTIGHIRGDIEILGDKCSDSTSTSLLDVDILFNLIEKQFGKIVNEVITESGLLLFWILSDISNQYIFMDMRPYNSKDEQTSKKLNDVSKNFKNPFIIKNVANYDKFNSNHLYQSFHAINNQFISLGLFDQGAIIIFEDMCRISHRLISYRINKAESTIYKEENIIDIYKPILFLSNDYFQLNIEQRVSLLNKTIMASCLTRAIYLKNIYKMISNHLQYDMEHIQYNLKNLSFLYIPLNRIFQKMKIPFKINNKESVFEAYHFLSDACISILNDLEYYIPNNNKIDDGVCLNPNFILRTQRAQQLSQYFLLNFYNLTALINKNVYYSYVKETKRKILLKGGQSITLQIEDTEGEPIKGNEDNDEDDDEDENENQESETEEGETDEEEDDDEDDEDDEDYEDEDED
jgi:hypothetical protein